MRWRWRFFFHVVNTEYTLRSSSWFRLGTWTVAAAAFAWRNQLLIIERLMCARTMQWPPRKQEQIWLLSRNEESQRNVLADRVFRPERGFTFKSQRTSFNSEGVYANACQREFSKWASSNSIAPPPFLFFLNFRECFSYVPALVVLSLLKWNNGLGWDMQEQLRTERQ